jgi:hypothetical protein
MVRSTMDDFLGALSPLYKSPILGPDGRLVGE